MSNSPLRFGFRRRCAWCGVVLRGWQVNLCRRCKRYVVSADFAGPPCMHGARWHAQPDTWRRQEAADA